MELPAGKSIEGFSIVTYAMVFILSAWGGTVHFVRRLRETPGASFTFAELVGDIVVSTFVGIVVFLLCQYAEFNQYLSVALSCIASNMGSKALYHIEVWASEKYFRLPENDRRKSESESKSNVTKE